MSKERFSKLQKWILKQCLKDIFLHRFIVRYFYGKRFTPSYKDKKIRNWAYREGLKKEGVLKEKDINAYDRRWDAYKRKWINYKIEKKEKAWVVRDDLITTKAMEVTISRSLKSLVTKGLLIRSRKWGPYSLTEKGFLEVNNWVNGDPSVNDKKCRDKKTSLSYNAYKAEVDKADEGRKRLRQQFNPSPERQKKSFDFIHAKRKFDEKFSAKNIYELCCEECRKKIDKFGKDCGIEELNRLAEELNNMV